MKRIKEILMVAAVICSTILSLKAQEKKNNKIETVTNVEDAAFLKKNKNEPGVKETSSGLQYKVIKMGTGPKPLKFSGIRINYTLKLFNGKILASNGNQIWEHRLDKTFYGMQEALKMMPAGSKWVLYMPAALCKSKFEQFQEADGRALMCSLELLAVK